METNIHKLSAVQTSL